MQTPDDAKTDILLIDRILARDQSAVGELYDRHGRLVFGLALRIIRDHGDAEEIVQEVFLQVWSRAETYNAQLGTPVAWLVRIARNRAIDRLRARGVREKAAESAPLPMAVASPEASASLGERQRAVVRALAELPREQRELIEHAYFKGLTQSELAEMFALPLGTVKTRVRTGLMALRRGLSQVAAGST
jgi:RNA polymerase sigma-70 factor (ECF subfamily)